MVKFIFVLSVFFCQTINVAKAQSVPDKWVEEISEISGFLESGATNKDQKFSAVTRDFDCEGLSLGYLNWTIRSKSFFSLLRHLSNEEVREISQNTMPQYGEQWTKMISLGKMGKTAEALVMARGWQRPKFSVGDCTDNKRKGVTFESSTVLREIRSFLLHSKIKEAQIKGLNRVARRAFSKAKQWAAMQRGPSAHPKFNEFAFFFDLATQNGLQYLDGLMKLVSSTYESETWQRSYNRAATSWIQINWDEVHPAHVRDGKRNAIRWRGALDQGQLSMSDNRLLLMTAFRGMLSKRAYSTDTMNRKGLMITGFGWAHNHFFDNREQYRAMDALSK